MSHDDIQVCAVCGRVLDRYTAPDGSQHWMHSDQDREHGEDHPAVPVSMTEINTIARCDFCNTDFPRWVIPVRTFQVLPGRMSDGDWAACETCKTLIVKKRWESLVRRAVDNSVAAADTSGMQKALLKASLSGMYGKLRRNITGDPYPINNSKTK